MTTASDGVWLAKYRDSETGSRLGHSLGSFGELPANERFDASKKAAEEWFTHMGAGGTGAAVTVAAACAVYGQHLRNEGREAADDAASRFRRWVNASSVGKVAIQKLTYVKVMEWRRALAKTHTLPHDKDRKGEREPRSDSALNRDMASLRAALNFALRERLVTTDSAWKVRGLRECDRWTAMVERQAAKERSRS